MADRLVTNVLSDFGGRSVHVVTTGILLLVLTRTLGPESYGLLALALSVFTLSRVFSEFAIPWAAARYIAEFRDSEPRLAVAAVVESLLIVLATSTLVFVAILLGSDLASELIGEPGVAPLLVVGSLTVPFYTLHRYNTAILQGYEEIVESAKLHALEGALSLVLVSATVLYWRTAVAAIAAYVVAYGVTAVAGLAAVRDVASLDRSTVRTDGEIRVRILRYTVPLSVTGLSNEVDDHLDVVLVGFFTNPTQVAFYSVGKQISQFTRVPAASIGFALSPTYGAQTSSGQVEAATAVYEESLTKTLVLYVPACVGLFIVADPAITLIFGEGYAGAIVVVQILAAFVLFEALENITGQSLDYLGRARARAVIKAATAGANVVLNVVLIPPFGAAGAAVATVITFGAYTLFSVYVVYLELPFDYGAVGRSTAQVTVISLGMGVVVAGFLRALSGFLALGIGIAVGVVVWFVACQSIGLIDVEQIEGQLRG